MRKYHGAKKGYSPLENDVVVVVQHKLDEEARKERRLRNAAKAASRAIHRRRKRHGRATRTA